MTMTQLTHKQTLAKGELDLSRLKKNVASLENRLAAIAAEEAQLTAREQSTVTHLATLKSTVDAQQADYEQAKVKDDWREEGSLAPRTEGRQAQEARTLLEESAKALTDAERKATADCDKDTRRRGDLQMERQQLESDLSDNHRRERAIQAIMQEAHASIGEDVYAHVVQKFAMQEKEIAQADHAAQFARFELEGFSTEALAQLEAWPELQAKIRPRVIYRDSATDIMEQAIALLESLVSGGKTAEVSADVCRQASPWRSSLAEFLRIDEQSLWPALNTNPSDKPSELAERRDNLVKLLKAYRDNRRGITNTRG